MAKVIDRALDRANGETIFGGGKGIVTWNSYAEFRKKPSDSATAGSPDAPQPHDIGLAVILQQMERERLESQNASTASQKTNESQQKDATSGD